MTPPKPKPATPSLPDLHEFATENRRRIEALEVGQASLEAGQKSHTDQLGAIKDQLSALGGASKASSEMILTTINNSSAHTQELFQKFGARQESSDVTFMEAINQLYKVFGLDPANLQESGQPYVTLKNGVTRREQIWDELKMHTLKWGIVSVMGGLVILLLLGFKQWTSSPHAVTEHTQKVIQERTTNFGKPE